MSIPLTVVARLDSTTVGMIERAFMLDGPLAWAAAMDAIEHGVTLDPITPDHAPDMPLPLERWEQAGTWGWCCSAGVVDVAAYTALELRRKPATDAFARYTTDRRFHTGLGPHKARDVIVPAALVRSVTWHVLAADRARLEDLLGKVTHLSRHRGIGMGHVTNWKVSACADPEAWRARPLPTPGPRQAYRPPYWHPTRQYTVEAA